MKIWMLDPAAMTPLYDLDLVDGWRQIGLDVRLVTSQVLYEDQFPRADRTADYFFFRPLMPFRVQLRRNHRLRRVMRLGMYPVDLLRLWAQFQQAPPDILHLQWTLLPRYDSRFFARLAKYVPLVVTVHNPIVRAATLSTISDMAPYYTIASRLIVHSESNRQMLLSRFPLIEERVVIVPMAATQPDQPVPTRTEARARLRLAETDQVVLFFGIIKPYKGLIDLIEAAGLLKDAYPRMRVVIAGKAQDPFEPYAVRIAELGLTDRFVLHVDFIPDDDVPTFFAACDVICLPYRDASQSAVLLTNYRFGKPVVVTNVGGLPDVVEDGGNGFIVPPQDPPALAAALKKLLDDADLRARFGERSRTLAEVDFNPVTIARQTEHIYQETLQKFNQAQ